MLPGALKAGPSTSQAPAPIAPNGAAAAKPKPAAAKPPGEEAIVDRDLLRNGKDGLVSFHRSAAKGLEIKALSMAGEQISNPGEACRIDVVAGSPIETKPLGRANGLLSYGVEIEACPFTFTLLDGAVLVVRDAKPCEFAAADCRVDPSGFWGPDAATIDDKAIKQFEGARGRAETAMRANFRALLASAGKDKEAVKRIAAEQAGFSSVREVVCRNYAKEETHGLCALRMTQARGIVLRAEFEERDKTHGSPKKGKSASAETNKEPRP